MATHSPTDQDIRLSDDSLCIRRQLRELAIARVKKYYHTASNTHIFCQDDVSPRGIRGVGLFADEAFRDFLFNFDAWSASATDSAVGASLDRLMEKSPEVRMVKEIQVRVPERIKDAFRDLAKQEGVSLSSLVVRAIREQVALIERNQDPKSIIEPRDEDAPADDSKSDLSFRIEMAKLEALNSVATRFEADSKDLIRNFLFQYYDRHTSGATVGHSI